MVQKIRIFLKDCVINTKQIYKTYSAKRSRPTDFTDSQLLRAVMVISMLFTPVALLDGHVSETTSTCNFFKCFFKQVKHTQKSTFRYKKALSVNPCQTFYRLFAKLLERTTLEMTTELILHQLYK